jgi:RNA polymerase sigma-70 factor (ECF subfamily)
MPKGSEYLTTDLIERLKQGDRAAFEEMVKTYWETASRRASSLTRSWQDSEDLVQEAFARAWARVQEFRGDSSFGTWVLRIMENYHIDLQRKRARQPQVSLESLNLSDKVRLPQSLCLDLSALEKKWEVEELSKCIQAALQSLPDVYGKVIVLREVHRLSYEEMAEQMACSVEAIRCKLYRARRQMKVELARLLGRIEIVT